MDARTHRPQLHLVQALQDQRLPQPARGPGGDSVRFRQRMVQRLQQQGLKNAWVIDAMLKVPRHEFVDSALALQAYEDTSLPLGYGQTISKPSIVGRMLELACQQRQNHSSADGVKPLGRVLEIGTGCGYATALLLLLAQHVTSIERIEALHRKASTHLQAWQRHPLNAGADLAGLRLQFGDGCFGASAHGPFDVIVAAACGDEVPAAWLEQLVVGGLIVAPWQDPVRKGQVLLTVTRTSSGFIHQSHESVHFVPLKSGLVTSKG